MTLYPSIEGCNPCDLCRGPLHIRGRKRRGRKFLIWRDKSSGPLPPALLTNAFANPLKVCAAGGKHLGNLDRGSAPIGEALVVFAAPSTAVSEKQDKEQHQNRHRREHHRLPDVPRVN